MVGVETGACVVGAAVVIVGVGVAVAGLGVVVAGLAVVSVGVAVDVDVAVAVAVVEREADPDGEKIAGRLDDGGPPVHAETVARTRTIKAAQPRTVSRALPAVPGMLMRAFMKASLYARRAASRFPLRHRLRKRKGAASQVFARAGGS